MMMMMMMMMMMSRRSGDSWAPICELQEAKQSPIKVTAI
jgi:hypothetical protein